MKRRTFIQRLFEGCFLAGLILLAGCKGKERPTAFGNQEPLWKLLSDPQAIEEPIDLPYTKETPVFYRDASMGKADPSFVPKVGGG